VRDRLYPSHRPCAAVSPDLASPLVIGQQSSSCSRVTCRGDARDDIKARSDRGPDPGTLLTKSQRAREFGPTRARNTPFRSGPPTLSTKSRAQPLAAGSPTGRFSLPGLSTTRPPSLWKGAASTAPPRSWTRPRSGRGSWRIEGTRRGGGSGLRPSRLPLSRGALRSNDPGVQRRGPVAFATGPRR